MFGDPRQHQHMMTGVRRALASPFTPPHLRTHLAQRIRGGTMQPMAPRKTIVGPTGRSPIKAVATPYNGGPRKTVVGSTAQPPRKTVVGSTAAPPRKTLVGSTAAPPRKTTPGNLGAGGNSPLAVRPEIAQPNSASNLTLNSRSLGNRDANPGRSVTSVPARSSGPPNASMQWNKPQGESAIVAGGMGQTIKNMRPPRSRRSAGSKTNSAFFGG